MTRIEAPFLRDPALHQVTGAIEAGGHRIYVVGGAVRNTLLGRPVDDVDLATDARPGQVVALASAAGLRSVGTGIEHGTVTVIAGGHPYEVTSFRRDVETDGRRAVVAFSDDLSEDARRRDFTMNALYATATGEVIDLVGGLDDLRAGRLRFVGDARDRIREDYLRILRLFRFLAWYGRGTEPDALAACAELSGGLERISRERVGAELRKLLRAPDPTGSVAEMARTGVLDHILPQATPSRLARYQALGGPASFWVGRLAALTGQDQSDRLRLSRDEARQHRLLVRAMTERWSPARIGYHLDGELAEAAALLAQTETPCPQWRQALAEGQASPLPISAADLPDLHGAAIGRGLRAAEDAWIDSRFTLPRDRLVALALTAGPAEDAK